MTEDVEIEASKLSQPIDSGDKALSVEIYRIKGTTDWSLEIVDSYGNSTVWDDLFPTDSDALVEAKKAVLEETASEFVGPSDGKGDGSWR